VSARHQAADVAKQRHRKLEFLGREIHLGAILADLVALRVDLERGERQELLLFARIRAAQQGVHARQELLAPHRLDHVVVRPMLQRKDDILLGVAHGDEKTGTLLDTLARTHMSTSAPVTSGTCQSSMNRSKLSRPAIFMASRPLT
jgi:hypothetical protein